MAVIGVHTSTGNDDLSEGLRTIARRVQEMEARGKRMEDLLLQLLEQKSSSAGPSKSASGKIQTVGAGADEGKSSK